VEAKAKFPFIVTNSIKRIYNVLDELRTVGYLEEGDTNCLITGESGSGKSELVKRYAERYPRQELEEFTYIPVVYVKLSSPQSSKAFAVQILRGIGDPQEGKGAKTKEELFERIQILCRECRVELIILDEVQTVIQNRSSGVVASISDWFKDLMNDTNVPIVMVGMPWCLGFVQDNDQLDTRVGYRYYLESFRVSERFDQYIKFISLFSRNFDFDEKFSLSELENAYRLFAYSSGVVRATVGQIIKATNIAKSRNQGVDLECFQEALRSRGIKDESNVFIIPVKKLELREIVDKSRWVQQKSYRKERFKSAEYKIYTLNDKMELQVGRED